MVSDKKRSAQIILRINVDKLLVFLAERIISLLLIIKNFFGLIFFPYRTVRKISLERDYYQALIIFFLVFIYFKGVYFLRDEPYPATLVFSIFLINFFLTMIFFYFTGKFFNPKINYQSLVLTFAYSLFPTLVWFISTSILYIFLPPPRSLSFLGKGFSIFFIAYSVSLFAWKLILVFLSLRFSLKLSFYQISYLMILYLTWFLPYSLLLYHFRLFRIPFI